MRHAEVIERQLALIDRLRQPLELDGPEGVAARLNPELRRTAMASDAYRAQTSAYRHFAAALETVDAWHIRRPISDLVAAAADSLPDATCLTAELIPAPAGFLIFDEPVALRGLTVGSLAWCPTLANAPVSGVQVSGLMVQYAAGHAPGSRSRISVMPEQVPVGVPAAFAHLPEASLPRLFVTIFLLLAQRVVSAERQPLHNRGALRRLSSRAGGRMPGLRVVQLAPRVTRQEATEDDDASRPVEWSHQWLVRGHWRQQPYRSTGAVRPLWIAPYVKGPSDKPLRVRRTVVNVS